MSENRQSAPDERAAAYERLRLARPELFGNPEDAATLIVGPGQVLAEFGSASVICDRIQTRSGNRRDYYRVVPTTQGMGVAVLPIGPEGIGLVKHFRHSTRDWHLEIPRGFLDEGESFEQAAGRELLEEIGAHALVMEWLGRMHADSGLIGGAVELFAATISSAGALEREEGVDQFTWVGVDKFREMILEGVITDSFTLAAYAMASLRGRL